MLIPTFGRHLLKFGVEIKKLGKPRWAKWNSFCWLLQWTSMNGRQIFSIRIVLKCQRSSEAQTFARLQHFCTFVIEIKDRMQYCMEESKRGCRAWALGIGTRSLYALLRAGRVGVITYCTPPPPWLYLWKLTTSIRTVGWKIVLKYASKVLRHLWLYRPRDATNDIF